MPEWRSIGAVQLLIEAMRADPERIFTAKDAAQVMNCRVEGVHARVKYAIANKAIFVKTFGRGVPMVMRGTPFPEDFIPTIRRRRESVHAIQTWKEGGTQADRRAWATDPDDIRIGKVVPGWKPPKMVHVRGGE